MKIEKFVSKDEYYLSKIRPLKKQIAELKEKAINAVPTNWLDPLLTGKDVTDLPWDSPEIEQLLRGVKERIRQALK